MTFLFYTDIHLTGRNPPNRKDKYPQTLISKLEEVYGIARTSAVDFVLFGGDLFDSHRCYAYEVLAQAVNVFRTAPCATWMLMGQHDLIGYNRSSFEYSTAHFVSELSCGKLLVLNEPREFCGVVFHPCHVFDKLPEVLQGISGTDKKTHIVMAHSLVTERRAVFDTILVDSLPVTPARLVLCGDYHGGFGPIKRDGTLYYNPGAMARQKATTSEMSREVFCALVEVNGGIIKVSPQRITNALPASSVFLEKEPEVEVAGSVDVDPFIERLEQIACEATDIFELLQMMATPGTDPRILRYIEGFRKAEK